VAAKAGDIDILRYFIEKNDVKVDLYDGELLREAAEAGKLSAVDYLLSKGADPVMQGGAALRAAAEKGHVDILKSLFAAGADIKTRGPDVLYVAAEHNKPGVAEFLLQAGTPAGASLRAMTAAARRDHVEVLCAMLANGVKAGDSDSAAFREAVSVGKFSAADILLKAGADIDAADGNALRTAVILRNEAAVKWLLDNGAATNFAHGRETPLVRAAVRGDIGVLKLLLDAGADPSAQQYGAIRAAREYREKSCARLLYAAAQENLALEKKRKLAEFAQAFGGAYSLSDLRAKKGPSGESGLLIAAQTGAFDKIIQKAEGLLAPSDLYHPDEGIDTVMSHLKRHKSLAQFFDPSLWEGRGAVFLDAHAQLPPGLQKRIDAQGVVMHINQREMQRKMRAAGSRPPKL
jgi:ankyrin repeat protein